MFTVTQERDGERECPSLIVTEKVVLRMVVRKQIARDGKREVGISIGITLKERNCDNYKEDAIE